MNKMTFPLEKMSHPESTSLALFKEMKQCRAAHLRKNSPHPHAPVLWRPVKGDLLSISEYIKDGFYFATFNTHVVPKNTANVLYFNIDDELIYDNFYSDFGPLHLGHLHRYCCKVLSLLRANPNVSVVHYTWCTPEKRANAAFLAASFAILFLDMTPEQAYHKLTRDRRALPFKPFQDASAAGPPHTLSLLDCLRGLHKAHQLGFFDPTDFDVVEFERCRGLAHGDTTWLVPARFLAFCGPNGDPDHYVRYFSQLGVAAVIRLNRKTYDARRFTRAGIRHYDVFLVDGSCPSRSVLSTFLHIVENTPGPIAVHCKAGLGRTGSLIGAYLVKHCRMTALEAIAWMRICRPGSVIGQQQDWLQSNEAGLWREGDVYRLRAYGDSALVPMPTHGVYSLRESKARARAAKARADPRGVQNHAARERASAAERGGSGGAQRTARSPWRLQGASIMSSKQVAQLSPSDTSTRGKCGGRRRDYNQEVISDAWAKPIDAYNQIITDQHQAQTHTDNNLESTAPVKPERAHRCQQIERREQKLKQIPQERAPQNYREGTLDTQMQARQKMGLASQGMRESQKEGACSVQPFESGDVLVQLANQKLTQGDKLNLIKLRHAKQKSLDTKYESYVQ